MVLSSAGERTVSAFISQLCSPVQGNLWASVFLESISSKLRMERWQRKKALILMQAETPANAAAPNGKN